MSKVDKVKTGDHTPSPPDHLVNDLNWSSPLMERSSSPSLPIRKLIFPFSCLLDLDVVQLVHWNRLHEAQARKEG